MSLPHPQQFVLRLRSVRRSLAAKRIGFFHKTIALLLLINLSTTSLLAAPEAPRFIVVSATELSQDIRFAYLSSSVTASIYGYADHLLSIFTSKKRNVEISRIEILPGGDLAIRQGEPVNFSAIAYTPEDTPIGGLKFDWTVQDNGRGLPPRPLPNGNFHAKQLGDFAITANSGGHQAQINVTVEENRPLAMLKAIKDDEAQGKHDRVRKFKDANQYSTATISSKEDYGKALNPGVAAPDEQTPDAYDGSTETSEEPEERLHGPNAGDLERVVPSAVSSNRKSRVVRRPADEDGWNNTNWWLADDPNNQTGNPPGTSPEAGAGNGNFQFSTPVVALSGRGIDLALSLNYNSRVWSKAGNVMSFDSERGFPAPGWELGFGKMMFMGTSGGCMIIDADGTKRAYTGTISNYSNGTYSSTSFTGHTADGSFIDYSCSVTTQNGVTSMSGSSQLPNGTTISYNVKSNNGKQAFPTQITDAQGNYINITYRNNRGPAIQTITDTLGRVITFNYDSLSRLISIDVPKMDNAGTRTAVRLHYKQITLNPGWAYPTTTDTNNSYPYVVDAIYYPATGTGYWFGADPNAADYGTYYSSYGMIAKVIEQRGMGWSGTAGSQGTVTAGTMSKQAVYDYPLNPDYTLTDAPTFETLTESWAGMDTDPAVTTYAVNMNASPRTITVTQPNGVKSKQYMYNLPGQWNDGLIYQDETLDGSNNVISKSVVTWQQGDYASPRPTQTLATNEKGQTLKTTYGYLQAPWQMSFYNQVVSKKEYDYDGTTLLKETRNTYENNGVYVSRHIFSLVKSTEIYDGTGNKVSKTVYEYDNNAVVNGTGNHNLKATPGVMMHLNSNDPYTTETTWIQGECIEWMDYCVAWNWYEESVYDSSTEFRGNLTKTTVYSNASASTGAIAETKQYDVTGNLVAESASCCQLKTYDYADSYSDAIVRNTYAHPTKFTRGSSDPNSTVRNTSTAVYDFYTGLAKQSTDPNGQTTTTYNPDTLRPTVSTSPTGAYSHTTYDETAMTITEEVKESNGTIAGKTISYLNGMGQVKKQESIGPNNDIDIVETKYNQFGEVWKQSRPYRSNETPWFSERFYDLQGRLVKIVEPDLSKTEAFYNEPTPPDSATVLPGNILPPGNTIRVVDAWGRERWGRYDALGRLVEVVEPNPGTVGSGSAVNVALASNGAIATASSEYNGSYPATAANDGDRKGQNWGSGGGWNDATGGAYPDWLQVDFGVSKTINEIDVFTLQDNYGSAVDPTETMTFASYGVKDFDVQYWDGSAWVTVSGGNVTNNDKVWRKFTFSPITTSKIRVVVNNALASHSRVVEVEAWTAGSQSNATGSVFDPGSFVTKYTYDALGRLVQSDQGGQFRKFKYDSLGRIIRQKLAEQTATLNDAGQYVGEGGAGAVWSSAAIYDDRSNLTERVDARGVKAKYSYKINGADDPLNRLQSISYDLSGPRDMSKPIPTAPTVSYEYETSGDQDRVKKVTAAGISTDEFVYDTHGRLKDHTKTILNRASYPLTTNYAYDTLDRVIAERQPAQYGLPGFPPPRKLIEHTFDTAGRLETLTVDAQQHAGNIGYDAAGQTTSIDIGPTGVNQVNEKYSYDPQNGLLTNQKVWMGASKLMDLDYDYARNNSAGTLSGKTGHLTKIIDKINSNKNREYQYDALGRLTQAKGGTNSLWTQTYTYDRYGNRTSVAATGNSADAASTPMHTDGIPNLTFNAANNRITTSNANGQFEYDVVGNQTRALDRDGTTWLRFEYDAANRLVNIKQDNGTPIQSQAFGVGNERLSLTDHVSNQTTYYCGAVEYTEQGGSGVLAWSKSQIFLGGSVLSTITPTAQGGEHIEYNHPDRLGTRLITSGGTSYEQVHLPFGIALDAESTATDNSRRFTSYERSSRTGLDYAQNRTYDSKLGRFTQVDPIGMSASSLAAPQTLNLYTYCGNDPINYTDPSGLFWGFFKKLFKWVMVAVAVVVAVMSVVGLVTAITTIGIKVSTAMVLGTIAAVAGATSQVLGAFGLETAAMVFGLIAIGAGFGNLFASKGFLRFPFSISEIAKDSHADAWFGIFAGSSAVTSYLEEKRKRRKRSGEGVITQPLPSKAWGRRIEERWRNTDKEHRREKAIRDCMRGLGTSRELAASEARADSTGVTLVWSAAVGARGGILGAKIGITLASIKAVTVDEVWHRTRTLPNARKEQPGDRLYCEKQVSGAGL